MEGDPFAVVEAMAIEAFAVGAAGLPLHPRRVPAGRSGGSRTRSPGGAEAGLLGDTTSTSSSGAAPAPTSAARRRRCSSRSRASAASRATSRRSRSRSACSASRPSSTTSRRWSTSLIMVEAAGLQGHRHRGSTGPKLFCLSGSVERPGIVRGPIRDDAARAARDSAAASRTTAIQAILLGGAAGIFVGPRALDLPLTFEARAAGATLGSGVVMVFDETTDLVDTLTRIAQFFRDESCGQCVPCRVGTVRQEELLARLRAGFERAFTGTSWSYSRRSARRCASIDLRPRSDGVLGHPDRPFRRPGLVAL